MKLLGAELVNFACFDRQYVPLRDGISVLVGRNNAGKTAILRGLSALSTMTLGRASTPGQTNLTGYLRNGESDGFDLELLCQLEAPRISSSQTPHMFGFKNPCNRPLGSDRFEARDGTACPPERSR